MAMERKMMLQGSSSDINNVAFLPSGILFRRLSVCDVHRFRASTTSFLSESSVFNFFILITEGQGEESGYLMFLAQMNNLVKVRILHF